MEGKEQQIPPNIHYAYILKKEMEKKNFFLNKEVKFASWAGAFKFSYVSMKANLISINQNFVL